MTKTCLVTFVTVNGIAVAEVHINSLHQLALLMPASVVSYEVYDNGDCSCGPVIDSELYELLLGVIADTASQISEKTGDLRHSERSQSIRQDDEIS